MSERDTVFNVMNRMRRENIAEKLWRARKPLAGSPAARYLGLANPNGRYDQLASGTFSHPTLPDPIPVLLAAIRYKGVLTAVQRTFLSPVTHTALPDPLIPVLPMRTLAGYLGDGAVEIGQPASVLGLAPSVEDAVAASAIYSIPVWSSCGVGRMHTISIPRSVSNLLLFFRPRHEEAGWVRFAEKHWLHRRGRQVSVEIMS